MSQIDIQFLNSFVHATVDTLKIQCQVAATQDKPFIKGKQAQPDFGIAGLIKMNSNAFNGSIAICFPEHVYLNVISKMMGSNYSSLTDELQDGAAEILNIIFGTAKVALSQKGYTIEKAIPRVLRGQPVQIDVPSPHPIIVIPFKVDSGELHIEIITENLQ